MKSLIKTLIAVLIIYIGFMLSMPWIKFYIFKNSATKRIDEVPAERLIKSLLDAAEETGVPFKSENLKTEEFTNYVKYIIEYKEVVKFPVVKKEVIFDMKIERDKPMDVK